MTEYAVLQLLAWVAMGAVMFLFAATGGFDLGAGILLPFLGKNDTERRVVINIVGPTWDGNQVWLVIIGAGMFAIWPKAYAAAFSGFYFAMLLVLWSLFLRPVSFEYRSKLENPRWRAFWDLALFLGSLLPALLFGVALGNIFMGIPFHYDAFSLRFIYTGLFWGLLRPFALLAGIMSVCMFCMHGAAYLSLRSEGLIYQRAKSALRVSAICFLTCFILAGIWLQWLPAYAWDASTQTATVISSGWHTVYSSHPALWIAPLISIVGAILVIRFTAKSSLKAAFAASLLTMAGVLASYGLTMFPFVFPSNEDLSQSLLIWNVSSSAMSLLGILLVALVTLPIIFFYTNFVYRKLWGRSPKMSVEIIESETHHLY